MEDLKRMQGFVDGDDSIPLIDLAPFFDKDKGDNLRQVVQQTSEACERWGFFQVINHGLDPKLMKCAAANAKQFFELPTDEKLKLHNQKISPIGFVNQSIVDGFVERREHLLVPNWEIPVPGMNVWPEIPANFRTTAEELMHELHKVAKLLLSLITESLGLPKDHLKDLYHGIGDVLVTNFYPASPADYKGPVLKQHKDGDILTLVAQLNESEGLQVLKDEDNWITVKPIEGSLVVNVGDVLQVWTNDKYKSVMHRVASNTEHRYSFAYFHQAGNDTLIQPLPSFTVDVNEPPRYRPFVLGDYTKLRQENRRLNSKNAKEITIEHYAFRHDMP